MSENGHIMEHLLVHEYFIKMMPFGNFNSTWDAYVHLIILYGMIKFLIIGLACDQEFIDINNVLLIIQVLFREILHNNIFMQQVIEVLFKNDISTISHMTIIAMN